MRFDFWKAMKDKKRECECYKTSSTSKQREHTPVESSESIEWWNWYPSVPFSPPTVGNQEWKREVWRDFHWLLEEPHRCVYPLLANKVECSWFGMNSIDRYLKADVNSVWSIPESHHSESQSSHREAEFSGFDSIDYFLLKRITKRLVPGITSWINRIRNNG